MLRRIAIGSVPNLPGTPESNIDRKLRNRDLDLKVPDTLDRDTNKLLRKSVRNA